MSFNVFGTSGMTPLSFGRGRGLHITPVPFSLADQQVGDRTAFGEDLVHSPFRRGGVVTPQNQPTVELPPPQCASTSVPDPLSDSGRVVDQMSTIVQQIGQQLAESIMSHLDTSRPAASVHSSHEETTQPKDSSRTLDLSQVQLVTQRGVKDPPVFRGETSDTLSVDEWEDSMKNYIRKSGIRVENQAEEILMHLRGRAKDVVRFGIRNGEVDVQHNPQAIYGLLCRHFSTSHCSSVPLADFYSTIPKQQEDPYEYWLRLNRAADVAASCLEEQGKMFDGPSIEVTRMFIRHCPSKDLALTFRSKTIDRWSAREVQEVLDEYHLEKGFRSSAEGVSRIDINRVEVGNIVTSVPDIPGQKTAVDQENSTLERLVGMLEKVLLQGPGYTQVNKKPHSSNRLPKVEGLNEIPCSICNDASHSALTHCRENRLCFLCHLPGHPRRTCLEGRRHSGNGQQGN
ncbi:uncharacterized protein LOC119209848 isoform X1 [Pungitius pungitius]|uniref:uncharacterized protein LOC119209848 isoform X1 n=1 Tax=Pungitius pungitius TaxID=134920 RepID=UPI002E14A023